MKPMKLACAFTPAVRNLFGRFFVVGLAGLVALTSAGPLRAAESGGDAASTASPGVVASPTEDVFITGDDGVESTDSQGIAAIVNDQVISRYDLDQRTRLVMVTSGIPDDPETVRRIQGQVLRSLIDEALETQEARRLELKIDPKDIERQYNQIATRSNMTTKDIDAFLEENGVSKTALATQLFAEIAWSKVVNQQFGPLISIGDDEVDDLLERLKTEADQPRYLVSEILLTFDTPEQEAEMTGGARRLVEQIRLGAPFDAVARQFSQSASAANGGDIGWVHASQLPRDVASIVEQMPTSAVSDPIRTLAGLYIVQLRNKQTGLGPDPMRDKWTLVHVLLPLLPDAGNDLVQRRAAEAEKFLKEFKSCDAIPDQLKPIVGAISQAPRSVTYGQLDPKLRESLTGAKPGQVLKPIRSAHGVEMVAICDFKADTTAAPTREEIEDGLYSQQLSMMGRRHLRDLRRDAVIDIR